MPAIVCLASFWDLIGAHYGNVASVVGLALTFYVMWKLGRIRTETQIAVQFAIQKIRLQWVQYEVIALHQRLRELVLSVERRDWPRALDRCSESRNHISFLRDQNQLLSEERIRLATLSVDMATVLQKLEQVHRSKAKAKPPDLTSAQKRQLSDIIEFVSRIESRLKDLALETVHGK